MACDLNMGGTIPKPLSKEQRELLKPQPGSVWGCYKRVWSTSYLPQDHDIGAAEIEPFREQMRRNRRESCFFVEHQEGMEWPAAEELQRLQYENRHLAKSFRMTRKGLNIAAGGLVVSAVAALLNFIGLETIVGWVNMVSEFFS